MTHFDICHNKIRIWFLYLFLFHKWISKCNRNMLHKTLMECFIIILVFLPTPLTMIHTNLLKHIVKDYICKRLCSVSPSYPHLRKLVFHSPFCNSWEEAALDYSPWTEDTLATRAFVFATANITRLQSCHVNVQLEQQQVFDEQVEVVWRPVCCDGSSLSC